MNPELDRLHPYPFEKLHKLKAQVVPPAGLPHIALSIGEPKHDIPDFVQPILTQQMAGFSNYPVTIGMVELRQTISDWLRTRFQLNAAPDPASQVIPVNGTREALFAFAQAVIDRTRNPLVVMPNPFYQIYEGAAMLAGAEPHYLDCLEQNRFLPDFDSVPEAVWQRCQLLYICSPGNPTGAVIGMDTLKRLIALADKYDFVIASDECYSEIYFDEQQPPPGLLQACAELGRDDYARCVVFHSLSKRSNLPGLRSGFAAGDGQILKRFLHYRTYHGCAMPLPLQQVSIAAWQDEDHVRDNRRLYQEKFARVLEILKPVLDVDYPDAGFYLWPRTEQSDTDFARDLFAAQNVTVLPGSFLSRDSVAGNPGAQRVRMALVASVEECVEAAKRIRNFIQNQ